MKKGFVIIVTVVVSIVVLALLCFCIARVVRGKQTRISSENGIQSSEMVQIGGIDQYIHIRGEKENNPVVLFLHGGPGNPISYVASYMQSGLEDTYTFVHWDQRGCGKTYYANLDAEISVELLLQDMDELVDYLCDRFEKDKIIIMGHSWGTVLGTKYCMQHPEKVDYYMGIGQVVDINKGEALAVETAIERAKEAGMEEDVTIIQQYYDEFESRNSYEELNWDSFSAMRNTTGKYLSAKTGMSFLEMAKIALFDPEMDFKAIQWFLVTNDNWKLAKLQKELQYYLFEEFRLEELGYEYQVPMYFICGDSDWGTPYPLVEEYYKQVEAPTKGFYFVEGAGHATYMDNQEGFANVVKQIAEEVKCQE